MFRSLPRLTQISTQLKPFHIRQSRSLSIIPQITTMSGLFDDTTPPEVKNAKGLHLITMSTPNGQKVQIMLEELKAIYGTEWTMTKM